MALPEMAIRVVTGAILGTNCPKYTRLKAFQGRSTVLQFTALRKLEPPAGRLKVAECRNSVYSTFVALLKLQDRQIEVNMTVAGTDRQTSI